MGVAGLWYIALLLSKVKKYPQKAIVPGTILLKLQAILKRNEK